ncbi:hypothetical protein B5K05_17245 [Rhizobium phaseoli]|nr:hypothetical protein CO648_08480 [Rhizobium phaseoli]RDJ07360.1 hypothetical protein B5K04_17210 [Rhizobium phaseoli]RDJ11051.1 hypothetical protein B5K05_17245 [Rhizobium phaseoli]
MIENDPPPVRPVAKFSIHQLFPIDFAAPDAGDGAARSPAASDPAFASVELSGPAGAGGPPRGVGCFLKHTNCLFQIENSALRRSKHRRGK